MLADFVSHMVYTNLPKPRGSWPLPSTTAPCRRVNKGKKGVAAPLSQPSPSASNLLMASSPPVQQVAHTLVAWRILAPSCLGWHHTGGMRSLKGGLGHGRNPYCHEGFLGQTA